MHSIAKFQIFIFRYFKRKISIFLEFLPRILFFWPLFGYMMILMFLKWVKYGANKEERNSYSCCTLTNELQETFLQECLSRIAPHQF